MHKYRNKTNLQIISDYLSGQRPFTQVGYQPPSVRRQEGEQWTDINGVKWEQKNGYKVQINNQATLIRKAAEQKCACGQDIRYGNKFDEKFFIKTGKCYDCVIKEETELRILGVYHHYETYKMLSNYLAYIKDIQRKLKDSVNCLNTENGTLQVLCNSEGFLEKFTGLNTSELLQAAKKDLEEITATIKKVTKDRNKAKKIYEKELANAIQRAKQFVKLKT